MLNLALTWLIIVIDGNACFLDFGDLVLHHQRNLQTHLLSRHLETHFSFFTFTSDRESHTARRVYDEAYGVQVQDDFPRLRLHFLHHPVGLEAVRRQAEAAQQTHLHDGHARRIQTQTLRQTAEGTTR